MYKKFYKTIGYLILIIGAISMLLPFVYMFSLSFMTDKQIFTNSFNLFPNPTTLENYTYVINNVDIFRYFFNSMFVAIATTIGQVIISALAGYAFARFEFKHKEILFILILVSMMIPPQVNIVPLFFIMKQFHWIDTYWALIVPGLFGGFGVFMMRQWFKSMPDDMESSAKIDGCNTFQVFYKIALPLALPALMTLAIFTFITTWNSFMWPLIVTNSDSMRTLPLALANFKGSFREITDWGALCAFSVICCIPVIGVFLLGRKYFINDILNGGIKE
ncbi:TPA: carbohydrate ABC transporter permease [Candidatus Avigastranaerophilus faecigallinarum]|nr:carbohydrate ABC transporter permease [Candidatus Avigastranaerophilus faecigallinarum]